LPLPQCYSYFR